MTTTAPAYEKLKTIADAKLAAVVEAQRATIAAKASEKVARKEWDTAQRDFLEALTGRRPQGGV